MDISATYGDGVWATVSWLLRREGIMDLAGRHSPEAVANRFLELAKDAGRDLTPMHLQKLVYIAHGWSLAILKKGLVSQEPQAWKWGPVYPSLYDNTKRYGSGVVYEPIRENNWALLESIKGAVMSSSFSDEEDLLIRDIFEIYGDLEAFQLSALTHNEGTPWSDAYSPETRNTPIKNDKIKAHFDALASQDA